MDDVFLCNDYECYANCTIFTNCLLYRNYSLNILANDGVFYVLLIYRYNL